MKLRKFLLFLAVVSFIASFGAVSLVTAQEVSQKEKTKAEPTAQVVTQTAKPESASTPAPSSQPETVAVKPAETTTAALGTAATQPAGATTATATATAPIAPTAEPAESTEEKKPEEKAAPMGPTAPGPAQPSTGGIAPTEEAQQKNIVSEIEIRGNQIISSSTILNKIKIRRGDPLLQAVINEDIKRLYGSGFFQDIKVDVQKEPSGGFRVIFIVEEKPIVRQIIIEGNTAISESKIRKEIKLIEGQILDPKVVKEGVVAVQNLYMNKGFKFVEVKSETDVNANTKEAILYILIDEGQKYKIGAVKFEGNKAIKSKKLNKLMRTKSRNLLFLHTGVFHEDHFQNDLEKLRAAFQKAGYADVKVEPSFDYDKTKKQMIITIKFDQGQLYKAGDIKIQGNILFPESELWEELSMLPGDVYSQFSLNDDLAAIQKFYFYQGYISAQVEPQVNFNRDSGKVDVVYNIQEGDLFFVNKVKIRGNTKTKDMVIRRELRIHPGEKFDGSRIDKSKDRLDSLGYFEEVSYDSEEPEEQTDPNKRDLVIKVKEKQTGQISFGGGISSIETLMGFAEISQNNFDLFNWPTFTGGGQRISLTGRLGTQTRDIDFNFTEPYILNKPYSYNLSLYWTKREYEYMPWTEEHIGAANTFGHQFTDAIGASIGITAEHVKLVDIADDAPPSVVAEGTSFNLASAPLGLSHDTRNNRLNPSRGHLMTLNAEMTAGTSQFYSAMFNFDKFWTLFKTHVLESRTRLGSMNTLGSSTPIPVFERFYAGGLGTLRGFGYRRVSPLENDYPIGGNSLAIQNIDYTFPIIDNFKGVVFVDIGQVASGSFSFFGSDYAASIGPGVKVNTPIGPMLFYYGIPVLNADSENPNGRFEFSIAKAF